MDTTTPSEWKVRRIQRQKRRRWRKRKDAAFTAVYITLAGCTLTALPVALIAMAVGELTGASWAQHIR